MAFLVHRAERADLLVEGLAELLREPPEDPFATELVIVPARGVERWLSQRLSRRLGHGPGRDDGVCAGVEFRSPASLTAELLQIDADDPWAPESLMWALLRAIDASMGEPWARVLAEHLGHGLAGEEGTLRRGRRLAVARRLAGRFAAYAVHRPALLVDWEGGGSGDGGGGQLPEDLAWQPELWRRTVAQVGLPSPVERHAAVVAALEKGQAGSTLPDRVSLFGHTRTSATEAALLAALGHHRDVHLWLPHPSDALWQAQAAGPSPGWRRDDRSHTEVAHPLLAAMGRDIREAQGTLVAAGARATEARVLAQRPATVLGQVQSDIAADRAPSRRDIVDASIQVHACHGPARQVEVLREVILGLLADDPSLEPRDIVVMCPDIEAYAPLLTGAFGLGDAVRGSHPGHQLRVMLADRSPTQTNPLLAVLVDLVALADGRAEATRVLDLLSRDPVRLRFGFSESDLETMATWLDRAGIRWAWDADGREQFGLGGIVQNTWRFGLDRLLAGVALSDDSGIWLDATLPLDDVSTTDISLVGRFVEAVDRLHHLTNELSGEHEVGEWLDLLRDGVDRLTDVSGDEAWQAAQVRRELSALGRVAGAGLRLRLSDVRSLLDAQLGGRPTRANFRTGTLTICTMTPMRSVPHRVICLLGLDDGVFPRGGSLDGDDILGRLPRVGEPDVRSQDRQLFLDAVMAATETLVITYTGFNESTGQPRPPSVPLREFLDVVEQTTPADVVRRHRSQGFHRDYLTAAPDAKPFSFDPDAAAAARAASGVRTAPRTLAALQVPPRSVAGEVIDLAELIDAVVNPVRTFLRNRMEIDLPREEEGLRNGLPVSLSGLEEWQVGDRMFRELLDGRPMDAVLAAEWRRGSLPPGKLGWRQARSIAGNAGRLAAKFTESVGPREAGSRDLRLELKDGRVLTGTVGGLYEDRLVRVGYSRLKAKARLEAWVSLVALSAQFSDEVFVGRAIGRAEDRDHDPELGIVTYAPVQDAASVLADLVAFRDLALTRVVPYAADSARVFATTDGAPYVVDQALRKQWSQDNKAPEMTVAWGKRLTLPELREIEGERRPSLFEELAVALWRPIRAGEAR